MKKPCIVKCTIGKRRELDPAIFLERFALSQLSNAQQALQANNYSFASGPGTPIGYEALTGDGRVIFIHENPQKPLVVNEGQPTFIRRKPSYFGLAYRDSLSQSDGSLVHVDVKWAYF